MIFRSYNELITIPTFEERFRYLKLTGAIGEETFGFKRWLNQNLYQSKQWKHFRDEVIFRDNGCDLGVDGEPIYGTIIIHHINPITHDDILNQRPCVFDKDNVICTKHSTHNAIHYGDESIISNRAMVMRMPNDTCPWRKKVL